MGKPRDRAAADIVRFPAGRRGPRISLLAAAPLAFLIGFVVVWSSAGRGPEAGPAQSQSVGAAPGSTSAPPAAPRASASSIVGRASVVDGDTIRLAGESVRFNGIDAPESRQTCSDESGASYRCGAAAAKALDEYLAASRPIRCDFVSRDQYGRFVGDCFRADGASVSAWLVRNGHALDWPRYSKGRYASQQVAAQRERIGLWRGAFQNPWEWRAARN